MLSLSYATYDLMMNECLSVCPIKHASYIHLSHYFTMNHRTLQCTSRSLEVQKVGIVDMWKQNNS